MTKTHDVRVTMSKKEIHAKWKSAFLGADSVPFHEAVGDVIGQVFDPLLPVLDAGCGQGLKTRLLLERGYRVDAADFSPIVLSQAKEGLEKYTDQVRFLELDLTNIDYPSDSIPQILCWGVLMHIPDVGQAIKELSRVLRPGGLLVISEGNAYSIDSRLNWMAKKALRALRKSDRILVHTDAGLETWVPTADGPIMTRDSNPRWLISRFEAEGLKLQSRRAAELTEMYTRLGGIPRKLLRAWNLFWFSRIKSPVLAKGNLFVFRKE